MEMKRYHATRQQHDLDFAIGVGRSGAHPSGQLHTPVLGALAVHVLHLDGRKCGTLVRLLSPNRHCFVLVCRPLRLKSSASSATATSSSSTAQSSRLPTMESSPVRLFPPFVCLAVGCCPMAVSRQKRRMRSAHSRFVEQ